MFQHAISTLSCTRSLTRALTAFAIALILGAFACAAWHPGIAHGLQGASASLATNHTNNEVTAMKLKADANNAKLKLNAKRAKIKNAQRFRFVASLATGATKRKLKSKHVTWSVSNKRIAEISDKGVVRGKKSGTVTVTAKTRDGKKATAKVRIVIQKSKMARAIPVLTYHRITTDGAKKRVYPDLGRAVGASEFTQQMRWLKKNGYTTISTSEFEDWRLNGAFLPKKSVLVTIDDGFYETYYVAYPILKKYKLKATCFVIGHHVHEKTRPFDTTDAANHYLGLDAIAKLRKDYPNLELQSHTYDMHYRAPSGKGIVTALNHASIKADFARNKKFGFTSIAYPYGHHSLELVRILHRSRDFNIAFGYRMDYPATRTSPRYNIPRFKVFGGDGLAEFKKIVQTAR